MVYFSTALIVSGILCITEVWSQVGDAERQGGTPWATAEEEATDEVNDPALFKAIVDSMRDWSKRHRNKTVSSRRRRGAPSVCYDGVGCFDDTGYLDMAPSSPEIVQTRFLLYSARSPRSESPIMDLPFVNISTLDSWNVNVSLPTKVIVHGFGSSCSNVWVYEMRSALMSVEDCNVICVDWENGAGFPNYVRAAANTRLVGRQLSLLLETMSGRGLNLSNTHVIGFSLGAHAAAFAGSRLSKIYRITGLDPAGPLFESQDPANRLDSTDAEFVDVIHSNGETLILGGLGSSQPMGHVDFYPNGGRMQKGCTNLFVGAFTDIIWSGAALEARSLCNHRRAYKFFTDSVSPRCGFPAMACHSYEAFLAGQCFPCPQGKKCPNMGYYADVTKARGTLYLVTRDEEPFCAHQYLVRVESGPSLSPASSYGKIQITLVSDSQINETFTLTMKDDEELIAGSALSKIIVPHPALEQFSSLALLYTAYSGWISSGLAQWSVTSVYLMDSLSNKWTVCDKEIVLESGVEAIFPLVKGECNTTEIILLDSNSTLSRRNSSYYPTEVVYIGEEILEEKDKRSANGSGDPVDLSPPKVGASQSWVYRSGQERSINANRSEIVDLSPPKIGATQSWLYWGGQERSITVQLLPKRLARLVEGALSSDRVPRRLLSWITAPHSAPTASHYIPVSKAKKTPRRDREHRNITSEKMHT